MNDEKTTKAYVGGVKNVFEIDLTNVGHGSKVILNGEDISEWIRSISISAGVNDRTSVLVEYVDSVVKGIAETSTESAVE